MIYVFYMLCKLSVTIHFESKMVNALADPGGGACRVRVPAAVLWVLYASNAKFPLFSSLAFHV